MSRSRTSIVALAVVSEGLLIALAYGIAWTRGEAISWNPSIEAAIVGASVTLPLLLGNEWVWRWSARHPQSVYHRFSAEVIVPLCGEVPIAHIPIIALLSGIGEEALFRGALNDVMLSHAPPWVALVVTSVAFAYVHFIGTVRRYGGMIPLYSLVGAVLWLVWWKTDSLAAAAITHATYNFAAMSWIKARARFSSPPR
ncbi:MAG: CPBP family intramembrane metalloprotease [Chitinophagia bacterium]|nr:CPBP family intramembrane metalloprotease [Chitinophagia bacterium]